MEAFLNVNQAVNDIKTALSLYIFRIKFGMKV